MPGLLDDGPKAQRPTNSLLADPLMMLLQKAGMFPPGPLSELMDRAYHQHLQQASHGALAGVNSAATAGRGTNVLASPQLAKLQAGQMSPEVQAWFSQTQAGRSGFGSGLAYGNRDMGENF